MQIIPTLISLIDKAKNYRKIIRELEKEANALDRQLREVKNRIYDAEQSLEEAEDLLRETIREEIKSA